MDHWHGTFTSTKYSSAFVNGTIRTILPSIRKLISSHYVAEATITYTGVYRWNQSVTMTLNGFPDQTGTSSQKSYSFKGSYGMQTIDFKATNITDDKITGVYSTVHPTDTGTFELYKGTGDDTCKLL